MLQLLTLQLALTEVTLGSLLNALRIPLKGHLLAANQALILNWVLKETGSSKACTQVSAVAAVAKIYSVGGRRFKAMVAIFVQGLLFSLGTQSLGSGITGRWIGSFFLCLWPNIQGLLGGAALLLSSGDHIWAWIPIMFVCVSAAIATGVVLLANCVLPCTWLGALGRFRSVIPKRKKRLPKSRIGRALKGTLSWPLLLIICLHSLIAIWKDCWEPSAIGLLLLTQFFLLLFVEWLPWERLGNRILNHYADESSLAVQEILARIRQSGT